MDENEDVLLTVDSGIGLITLNRPKAINSLTHPMVSAISQALTNWEGDDAVSAVVVDGAGERGLCAGGDLVALYHSARADGSEAKTFWRDEYRMNAQIGRFSKPYVALMDGVVMGGGVGVAAHGSLRVVTDTTKMAMPEVGIGLIPDVGGTLILSRAPGLLGLHLAMTGVPFGAGDAIALGFADRFVPHDAARRVQRRDHRRRHRRRPGRARDRAAGERAAGHSGSGSTSAMQARLSRTSWPRCAATTWDRPTTPPT